MTAFDPEKITFFAKTDARGKNVPFGIKAKDRQRHMYVIGKTGMGKSTMLENMAIQDIQSGEGVAFIDPHGSTADKLLDYVPEHRMKDVLYFAPFDMDYPVSFNVMEDVGPDKRHLVVSGLMSTFKKIWVDAWSARMEYILSNTMLALLEYPDATLLGVNRMLSDKKYRDAVVANISDPSVKSFWVDEFAKYNERYMQEAGDAIKNKIGQFTANPLIRNIIGQPKSSFNVRDVMDGQKILIMNLSKGLVGETNANLLGSMLITRIYLSAMSRADLSSSQMEKMPNFYFYVDEFQSFANETFANILSEARKYKLNLTIAHQYIEQMEEEVRDAVFGNVGTTVAFRVGPLDAEFLETVFTPKFLATDLINLGFAQIYLSLMIDGIGSRPFSAVTLPPIQPAEVSHHDQIVAESRRQFAHPRIEVETAINKWHEQIELPRQDTKGGRQQSGGQHNQQHSQHDQNKGKPQRPPQNNERRERSERPNANQQDNRAPVKHKDVNELRNVLRDISGPGEKSKADESATQKREAPPQQKEAPKDHGNPRPVHDERATSQNHHTNVERTERSEPQKKFEHKENNRPKGSDTHAQNRRDERPRDNSRGQQPSSTKQPSSDDLRAVLANLVQKQNEKSAQKSTSSPNTPVSDSKPHKPPTAQNTPVPEKKAVERKEQPPQAQQRHEQPRNTMKPADEMTRKQLERMLRVNGQEKPPLR